MPGHQHRSCYPAEDTQARASGAASPKEVPRRKLPSRHASVASSLEQLAEVGDQSAAGRAFTAGTRGCARRARQTPSLGAWHHRAPPASLRGRRGWGRHQDLRDKVGATRGAHERGRSSPSPCISSCTTRRFTSAPQELVASLPTTSPKKPPRGKIKARVVIDGKLKAPSRLRDRTGRRSLRGRTLRSEDPALHGEGKEEGDIHRSAPRHARVPSVCT